LSEEGTSIQAIYDSYASECAYNTTETLRRRCSWLQTQSSSQLSSDTWSWSFCDGSEWVVCHVQALCCACTLWHCDN